MMKQKLRGLIRIWTESGLYRHIDNTISSYFRKNLRNHNFTILCSNCVGGVLYHRLGERFMSPTINLFFSQPDFVRFCVHLDHYLQKKLEFQETEAGYPVARLAGDEDGQIPAITIHFNHAASFAEAEQKWEARKKRIQRDNLFIILYKLDGVTINELRLLENVQCRGKVVLTAEPLSELSWSYYIKPNMRQNYPYAYLGRNLFGLRWIESKFDFVRFFNA